MALNIRIQLVIGMLCIAGMPLLVSCRATGQGLRAGEPLFGKQNLVAWCVVPFDIKKRSPEERAVMFNRLGITKFAYDWRKEHIPTFDTELDELNKHHIEMTAFWVLSGMNVEEDKNVEAIFSFIRRRKVRPQLWYMFSPGRAFNQLTQEQKIDSAARCVRYITEIAAKLHCRVGMYNHEGWYGDPENQLAIINKLKLPNLGMVYNFNHAQLQIDAFPEFYPRILPHLMAINLAGLKKGGDEQIYPVGKGNAELEMIRVISKSSFRGPIGIINEETDPDAEVGLKMNMDGLKEILQQLGDEKALKTYQ